MNLLSVSDLHVHLGQAHVLHGVSFDVPEGAVTALLGRNGVGKTTTLRSLVGLVGREGEVEYAGESIAALPTHRVIRRGIGDRKSTRLNSSHYSRSRMPSSA